MKITLVSGTRTREAAPKLPNNAYEEYATHLIEPLLDKRGNINKVGIEKLKGALEHHRSGGLTAQGYSVYTKYLLGAIKRVTENNQELMTALTADYEPKPKYW